ncbi:conserved hypothetical protein [Listeria monocytogenes]|nr:conserved hypothetical protein [Listeria monocytogenes]
MFHFANCFLASINKFIFIALRTAPEEISKSSSNIFHEVNAGDDFAENDFFIFDNLFTFNIW